MTISALFDVSGKTALVTGGGSGVGAMITDTLLLAGVKVYIASRKFDQIRTYAERADGLGECVPIAADLSTEAGVKALSDQIAKKEHRLDILVNNAGRTFGADFSDYPWEKWGEIFGVNVTAPFALTRDLTPLLCAAAREENPARVINIGSVVGTRPLSLRAYPYGPSKAALHHLTRILANELGPLNIAVNALALGPFYSRMTAYMLDDEANRERQASEVPLRRLGSPKDVGGAVLFLCSRAGAYVNGAVLPLDGGLATV